MSGPTYPEDPEVTLPSWIDSSKVVFLQTASAATFGSLIGLGVGIYKNHSRALFAINMGMTWGLVSLPFFGTRQCIIHYRQSNHKLKSRQILQKDRDALIGSVCGGAVLGAIMGRFYRGLRSVPSGILMYGSLATISQISYTVFRHWRQDVGLRYEDSRSSSSSLSSSHPLSDVYKSWGYAQRLAGYLGVEELFYSTEQPPSYDRGTVDPIGEIFKYVIALLREHSLIEKNDTTWTKAFNDDYKQQLGVELMDLYDEVIEKKKRLMELRRRLKKEETSL